MRDIFPTLAPELVIEIFGLLDDLRSTTRLASTCRYFHSIWLGERSKLCQKLVWEHPLLCEYSRPEEDEDSQVPEGVTLVESAKQLERLRRKFNPQEDGYDNARRILRTARQVRTASQLIVFQLLEFACTQGPMPWVNLCEPTDAWKCLAEPMVGRMLYRILLFLDRRRPISRGGQKRLRIRGERVPDKGLWELTSFVVVLNSNPEDSWHYWDETWDFPDVEGLIKAFPGCDCNEEYPDDRLAVVCGHSMWQWVMRFVIKEYEEIAEDLDLDDDVVY